VLPEFEPFGQQTQRRTISQWPSHSPQSVWSARTEAVLHVVRAMWCC